MRRLPPEPMSFRAVWARRLAWFAAAVAGLSALALRFGVLPSTPGLIALGSGLLVAALALVVSLLALREIWIIGARGLSHALIGLVLALTLLAWPGLLAVQAARLPAVVDVSTDLADPPAFSRSRAVLAARGGAVPPSAADSARERQRRAYPDLESITLELNGEEAWSLVQDVVKEMGWRVLESSPPSLRGANGRIEAVETSLLLRFPDDITIRVRPAVTTTRIDIRSVSRFEPIDVGSNVRRVRRFITALQAEAKSR